MGYSNGYRALIPHFTSLQPIFTSQQPIFTVFVIKVANSKREKWDKNDKNDKKRLEIAKSILFHIHKHCTTSFTSLQPIFTSRQPIFTVIWLPLKVANSKREKQLQNDIKGVDLYHRVFKGPPNALMGSYTPFYWSIPHFTSLQPIFTVFGCL